MFVLPDLSEQFEAAGRTQARRERIDPAAFDWPLILRIIVMLLATGLFFMAAGLWAHPTVGHAVLVIKLGASLVMFVIGAVLLSILNAKCDLACVQVDVRNGEIRTYEQEHSGQVFLTGRYDLRAMTEVSLSNRTLFVRDAGGRLVVSVPVRSRRRERALRAALSLG